MNSDRELVFTGSHYEVGQQIGEQYRQWGKSDLFIPDIEDSLYQQQLAIYQNYFPKYLELLEGIASGARFDKDKTIKSYVAGFLNLSARPRNTCSVIGLHRNNKVYIGRNYDWRESAEESARSITINLTDEAFSFSALSDMEVWEYNIPAEQSEYVIDTDDAWNKHGLFVCLNGAPGTSTSTGMSCTHIVQAAAEQCKNTTEAIDLISRIPCNEPKLFTIIDKSGDMAVVEKQVNKDAAVVRSSDSLIVTNHFQSKEYFQDNIQIFNEVPFHSTFARYAYLELNLAQSVEPNLDYLRNLMLHPPVIQNWRGKENGDVVTVWSEVIELTDNITQITYYPQKASKNLL